MAYVVSAPAPDAAPIDLPAAPRLSERGALPYAAALVPVVGAVVMWTVTGSPFMLWFAALGPLMLIAGIVDRARNDRRTQARSARMLAEAVTRAEHAIAERHGAERSSRRAAHPDLFALCADPAAFWRHHAAREDTLTVGTGTVASGIRVAEGDEREPARRLRAAAAQLADAPVVVPADGICVHGPAALAHGIVRALLLQLCLIHPPERLRVIGGDGAEPWVAHLPHAHGTGTARSVALVGPHSPPATADIVLAWGVRGSAVPHACRTVIDLNEGLHGTLRRSELELPVRTEAITAHQAAAVAAALASRAPGAEEQDAPVLAATLGSARHGVLGVTVGRADVRPVGLDIVEDGPHAVVVGTTGTGKSELLITWAAALCRAYSPDEVVLMLADFKGGAAFTALADLPHVVGILTDLDGALADRAVRSLAAEVRRRERAIAAAHARDIADPRVRLPRLVVMIDEFPALVTQHPELEPVFTDIAARGRALGMHLVLGAQRLGGAVREATLANMPLRVALRTASDADSRAVIGTADAAALPGGAAGRGVCVIRRSSDAAPQPLRVALTTPADIAALVGTHPPPPAALRPWLPPLPQEIPAAALPPGPGIALGVADEPALQTQPVVRLVPGERGLFAVGGAASGKSALIALIAEASEAVIVPSDPEAAWDVLTALEAQPAALVACDDLDVLLAAWPEPWAGEAGARLERLVRSGSATQTTFVFTAQRLTATISRIAELLPRRAILALPGRSEHLAAGGQGSSFSAGRPPGRADLDGREVQFALPAVQRRSETEEPPLPALAPGNGSSGTELRWADPREAHQDRARQAQRHRRSRGSGALVPAVPCWRPGGVVAGAVLRAHPDQVARLASSWGCSVLEVSALHTGTDVSSLTGAVLVGDPQQWQRAWPVLEAVRRAGELVVAAEFAAEVRVLTGERQLLPYARPGHAWVLRSGQEPRRVRWSEG